MSDSKADVITLLSDSREDILEVRDRYRGALLGLAVGDALGTSVEFEAPSTFEPVTGMRGGGPFHLKPGEWTDDTSLALCLAESLIRCRGFNPLDQMERYVRWWRCGYLSSNGRCFDIGNTTKTSLSEFERTWSPYSGPQEPLTAGNGSIMRLAPVALFFSGGDAAEAVHYCGESSRTTHGAPAAVDACRYLGALIVAAVRGASKEELLAPGVYEAERYPAIETDVAAVLRGSFKPKKPPAIRGAPHATGCLEAALWAFHRTSDFAEGCLLAVNLGEDADTTAAVYGQIAGAFYGESAIPVEWRRALARRDLISRYAEELFRFAVDGIMDLGPERRRHAAEMFDEWMNEGGGHAESALRNVLGLRESAKREMGVLEFYMSGSMGAAAAAQDAIRQLRVAFGVELGKRELEGEQRERTGPPARPTAAAVGARRASPEHCRSGAYAKELEIVREAVLEAGKLLVAEAANPRSTRGSHAAVDAEIGQLLVERLTRWFPRDGIRIEEGAPSTGGSSGRAFIIDPHDGTREFIRGRRETSISVALVDRGHLVLGVVYAPNGSDLTGPQGLIATWAQGEPLRKNDREVHPSSSTMLGPEDCVLLSAGLSASQLAENQRLLTPARAVLCASIATRLALVAIGDAAATLTINNRLADWDFAGGHALLLGAGGDLVGPDGESIVWEGTRTKGEFLNGYFGARTRGLAREIAHRYGKGHRP